MKAKVKASGMIVNVVPDVIELTIYKDEYGKFYLPYELAFLPKAQTQKQTQNYVTERP